MAMTLHYKARDFKWKILADTGGMATICKLVE